MKKFYKTVEAGTAPGGWVVRLNGKVLKTPLLRPLILSSGDLATEISKEWQAQGDEIIPATMPLTQLANTMLDKASGDDRQAMNKQVQDYARSDLVCYFATHPQDLVRRQEKQWQPLLNWLSAEKIAQLQSIRGIQYQQQDEKELKKIDDFIKGLSALDFTIVQAVVSVTGSVVIALAMRAGFLDAEGAYLAACVDEIYQMEKWGEDDQARKRLDRIRAELQAIDRFYVLSKASS